MHHHHLHDEKPVNYDPRLLKRMLLYARPYARPLALSLLFSLLITALQLAQPYVLKVAIDDYIIGPGSFQELQRLGLIFFGIYVGGLVLNYFQFNLLMRTGQRIIYDIRQDLFAHLQRLSTSFFDNNPVGRLVTRLTNDPQALNEMYTSFLVDFFKDMFLLIGIIVIMLNMHFTMALVTFSVFPLILLAILIYRKKALPAYREIRKQLARINTFFAENIAGIRIIQVLGQEKNRSSLFNDINNNYLMASLREIKIFAVFRPSMDLLRSLALALLLWYGSGQVLAGVIPFGVLYAFTNYVDQFFRPINDISEKYNVLQAATAASERIFQLLDEKEDIESPEKPLPPGEGGGSVEFKNVWFAYEDENWILNNVSFYIAPGEKIAVVGPTGAGKSTLINLVNRFYDVQKGEILFNGTGIKKLDLEELRRQVGVIHQDVFLFSGTVRDNITLNSVSLSQEELDEICKAANAYEFIQKLPHKYDTQLGERGITLSTGQRQLIAFARLLAFDPHVFIFDEATAHIDTYTEKLLQDSLKNAAKGRTSIIIAHRFSTIKNAERIFLIRRGELTEITDRGDTGDTGTGYLSTF